jgi:hypothetical protein
MRKNREILILLLLLILISCKVKNNVSQNIDQQNYTSESIQTPEKEPFFISDGCINITKKLNVRNAPSIKGKIIRQASFGDCFHIWEEKGSKITKDGVFDLWYKVSADKEEWINALYARKFPFYISSDEKIKVKDRDIEYRKLIMKIEGYREIDGKKELMADVESLEKIPDGIFFSPVAFRGFVELQEKYSFPFDQKKFEDYNKYEFDKIVSAAQLEYKATLLDSMFEILRNYSLEIEEINNLYNWFIYAEEGETVYFNGKEVYFNISDVDYEEYIERPKSGTTTFNINSSEIILTGIRVGSKEEDVLAYFGNDFTSFSIGYSELITYSLGCNTSNQYFPHRIIFDLVNGEVKKITRLLVY